MNFDSLRVPRRRLLGVAAAGAAATAFPGLGQAQGNYPNKPIRLIVPYPPGGGTDIVGRLVAQKMTQSMGQQVVVDNKPGASTIIGTEALAKAAPDGYTFGMVTDSHAINPTFFPKLPYDTFKDFAFLSQLVFQPLVLVAQPSLNVKTLREFIALAKSRPGRINYASIGNGTPHQLAMEWFKSMAGIDLTHVPYKGVAPALADLVAGQVECMFTGTSSAAPYVKEGRLVALGMSSAKRQAALPEVPPIAEAGLPDFEFMTWYGSAAPAGTPREIVQRLSREIGAALRTPDVKARLLALGAEPAPSTPEEFAGFVQRESTKLARLVRVTGVKAE
jgi:tripartite-type tricarboxylate transporter receptor subunit TctC